MLEKNKALELLEKLKGKDLHSLVEKYGVTFRKEDGEINKGWAGHVIERYLGLPLNSSRSPNLGSWELKQVPLRYKRGKLLIKETMSITKIDSFHVETTPFERSHLYMKLRRAVIATRVVGANASEPCYVYKNFAFELKGGFYQQVKADYELVQKILKEEGFDALTGKMGELVQPRTKGKKNSRTRDFYARRNFLSEIFGIDYLLDASKQRKKTTLS